MNRFKNLVLFVCLLVFNFAFADETGFCQFDEGPKTYLFFINGINYDPVDERNYTFLLNQLRSQLNNSSDDSLRIRRSINTSNGLTSDAWQAYEQLSDGEEALETARFSDDDELNTFVDTYMAALDEGSRVILLGHSQGSIYANKAYDLLEERRPDVIDSVGVVIFGSPDNRVAGNGTHVNLEDDWIVNLARREFGDTLEGASNMEGEIYNEENDDLKNHGFTDYVTGNLTAPLIRQGIDNAYDTLTYPPGMSTEGIITVQLSWSQTADVDLHIYEPNGTHVYYQNPNGNSGYLDRDDTTGQSGGEHYYVSCDGLEEGTYIIGANYFSGESTATGSFVLKGGGSVRNTSRLFITPNYGENDQSPRQIGRIEVDKTPNNFYSFRVLLN